jgi:hypothetical protein
MSEKMKSVLIHCPVCHKNGHIEVLKKEIEENPTGLTTIEIDGQICEHRFLIYVDKTFNMRESEEIDSIESPDLVFEQNQLKDNLLDKDELNVIKLNLYPLALTYILKCLIFNKKIGIIIAKNKPFLRRIYNTLFNYIFEDTFPIDYQILEFQAYLSQKDELDIPIILKDIDILQDQEKFLEDADLGVERGFVGKFYSSNFNPDSLNDLKMEIKNAFILANSIKELIVVKKKLNIYKIIKFLKKRYKVDVNVNYTEFLLKILKYRYHINLKGIYKNIEFLKFKKLGS